jgi:hypothetical protein
MSIILQGGVAVCDLSLIPTVGILKARPGEINMKMGNCFEREGLKLDNKGLERFKFNYAQ